MTDLSTTYLGLNLKNPLVASASPLSKKIDKAKKLEEAGIAAIVMYSSSRSRSSTKVWNWITSSIGAQTHFRKLYLIYQMVACTRSNQKNI